MCRFGWLRLLVDLVLLLVLVMIGAIVVMVVCARALARVLFR